MDWIKPERLAQRALDESGDVNANGDFGSYAKANLNGTLEGSGIESHNLVFAEGRVELYRQLWRGLPLDSIADMGCGLGLTAGALADAFPNARVDGYELSPDAVSFARRRFPKANFECRAIGRDNDLGRRFDLILCQEFYPFTRTSDLDTHAEFLTVLRHHLTDHGCLIIELSERDFGTSILCNLERLSGFRIERTVMPFDRVFRYLPFLPLAQFASFFLGRATRMARNIHLKLTPLKGH
ncbi:class I SAM-dependent methyltransferase [Paramagnetospirillum magnetotacticum]|uniref:class I SAM-dependent methyltransferase n=1 Tax=Paramagnetospirillum magnetotacticum TaxID=188 RepID=UPI0013649FDF|nr:class I SAM-dependent methyltransferase [Paramagnetospirillum magnetotacticum]